MQYLTVTNVLLALTIIISLRAHENRDLKYSMLFSPYAAKHQGKWWLIFTHALIHADFMHLGFNMFGLYLFGTSVEESLVSDFVIAGKPELVGHLCFAGLYIGGLMFATLPSFYKHSDNTAYHSLGASGAVSAVIFAFIIMEPDRDLMLIFLLIPIPGLIFGPLYLIAEYYSSKKQRTNIAHDAHIAGAIFGLIYIGSVNFDYFIDCWKYISSSLS